MQFASAIGIPGISTYVIETKCPYFVWFVIEGRKRKQITFTIHFGVGRTASPAGGNKIKIP